MVDIARWIEDRPVTDAERLELLEDLEASGLSVREFARRARLSAGTLWSWKRRLLVDEEGVEPDFVELRVREDGAEPTGATEVVGEVVLSGGQVVRVRAGFDERELARLLAAVARSC